MHCSTTPHFYTELTVIAAYSPLWIITAKLVRTPVRSTHCVGQPRGSIRFAPHFLWSPDLETLTHFPLTFSPFPYSFCFLPYLRFYWLCDLQRVSRDKSRDFLDDQLVTFGKPIMADRPQKPVRPGVVKYPGRPRRPCLRRPAASADGAATLAGTSRIAAMLYSVPDPERIIRGTGKTPATASVPIFSSETNPTGLPGPSGAGDTPPPGNSGEEPGENPPTGEPPVPEDPSPSGETPEETGNEGSQPDVPFTGECADVYRRLREDFVSVLDATVGESQKSLDRANELLNDSTIWPEMSRNCKVQSHVYAHKYRMTVLETFYVIYAKTLIPLWKHKQDTWDYPETGTNSLPVSKKGLGEFPRC